MKSERLTASIVTVIGLIAVLAFRSPAGHDAFAANATRSTTGASPVAVADITGPLPRGVEVQLLAASRVAPLRTAPAHLTLVRVELRAGASLILPATGVMLAAVTHGELRTGGATFAQGSQMVPDPTSARPVTAGPTGAELLLFTAGAATSSAATPVTGAGSIATPASPVAIPVPRVETHMLASGVVDRLPARPATAAILRVTIAPGASIDQRLTAGPMLVVVSSGEVTVQGDSGISLTLAGGGSTTVASFSTVSATNRTSTPVELLVAGLFPQGTLGATTRSSPTADARPTIAALQTQVAAAEATASSFAATMTAASGTIAQLATREADAARTAAANATAIASVQAVSSVSAADAASTITALEATRAEQVATVAAMETAQANASATIEAVETARAGAESTARALSTDVADAQTALATAQAAAGIAAAEASTQASDLAATVTALAGELDTSQVTSTALANAASTQMAALTAAAETATAVAATHAAEIVAANATAAAQADAAESTIAAQASSAANASAEAATAASNAAATASAQSDALTAAAATAAAQSDALTAAAATAAAQSDALAAAAATATAQSDALSAAAATATAQSDALAAAATAASAQSADLAAAQASVQTGLANTTALAGTVAAQQTAIADDRAAAAATVAALSTQLAQASRVASGSLDPTYVTISVDVDLFGVLNGDPAAISNATKAVKSAFAPYRKGDCRAGVVITFGHGNTITGGQQLAAAMNAILKAAEPKVVGAAAFDNFGDLSGPLGRVDFRLYLFSGCSPA